MTNAKEKTKGEKGKTTLVQESLMLSASTVGRTTSSSNAEKSVAWEEHRLFDKKNKLDEKLHKHMVKMNSDKLGIVDELKKLQKSKSVGSLEHLDKYKRIETVHRHRNEHTYVTAQPQPQPHHGRTVRRGSLEVSTSLAAAVKVTKLPHNSKADILKERVSEPKVKITVGCDSCSEDSSEEDKVKSNGTVGSRSLSCQLGRTCSSSRNATTSFENASRRYNNHLVAMSSRNGKS